MTTARKIWCDSDEHKLFEYYADFNEWLHSEEAEQIRLDNGIDVLSQPSKGFYAGDKEAYEQVFEEYKIERLHRVLNREYLVSTFGDEHWYERNESHFRQLVKRLLDESVVPFIGAGVSQSSGFPTWKAHLKQQGRTAGLDPKRVEQLIDAGQHEEVIHEIENSAEGARDAFIQEVRDVFSKTGQLSDLILTLSELFQDTLITTNYDSLLEIAYSTGQGDTYQVINGTEPLRPLMANKTSIIKLHGDIKTPAKCILSKRQYDDAYGKDALDMSLPTVKQLSYYFRNSSLLFLGCSLVNDRTVSVFKAVKATMGDSDLQQHFAIEQTPESEQELVQRNTFLASLGITPIWYKKGEHESLLEILKMALNELGYEGHFLKPLEQNPVTDQPIDSTDYFQQPIKSKLKVYIDGFIKIFRK